MDPDRARVLLSQERERIQGAIDRLTRADAEESAAEDDPSERGSEGLYEKSLDIGLEGDLAERLASVERAEARLAAGAYGLSVLSGQPIPDERLEARPTAELTLEEEQASGG
jgi:DnaK suppressor protein